MMTDLPSTMTALVQKLQGYSGGGEGLKFTSLDPYLEMVEIPVPVPGPDQVLIKMRTSSVNPSDLHFIKGEYGQPCVKGAPAGFEGCGDVVAAGENVKGLMGMRVAFALSLGGSGAWADYALTDGATCIPLRPDISDDDGAAQIVNPLTAMAMVDIAQEAGDAFILSAATSQLGKLMIGLGRDLGLKPVAMVRRADAVEVMKALGAAEVLVTTDEDFEVQLKAVCKALKPRVFLDAVGDQIAERVFAAMPNRGRWVVYGKLDPTPPSLRDMGQFIFMGKQIEGFWLTKWMRSTETGTKARVVGEVQARFADGRWKTDVSTHLLLRDVMDEMPGALAQPDGKVIITMG